MRLEDFLRTPGLPRPPSSFTKTSSSYHSVPSDLESMHIKSLIQDLQDDIDGHEAEMKRLRKALTAEKRRGDALRRDVDRYRAMISPVRKLPVEILMLIFEFCCIRGSKTFGLELSFDEYFDTTNALSQTCSLWRGIVTSSPKLWAKLSINLDCTARGMPGLVKYYLRRSDIFALHLNVFAHWYDPTERLSRYNSDMEEGGGSDHDFEEIPLDDHACMELMSTGWQILADLLRENARWYDVHIELDWDIFDDERFKYTNDLVFVSLHSLSLSWPEASSNRSPYFFNMLGRRYIPNLYSLAVKNMSIVSGLPLSRVQKIIMPCLDMKWDIYSVFRYCPNAKEVVFVLPRNSLTLCNGSKSLDETETYMHIESLTVESPEGACTLSCILRFLNLPNLTTLNISATGLGDGLGIRHSLSAMLRRSVCSSLSVLDLSGDLFVSDRDLIEILSLTPSVTNFSLDARLRYPIYFTWTFFQRLTFDCDSARGDASSLTHPSDITSAETKNLLPRLQVCHFSLKQGPISRFFGGDLPDPEDILRMLKSRRSCYDGRDKLMKFGLFANLCWGLGAFEWAKVFSSTSSHMSALRQDGLELELNISFMDGKRSYF
ncbi:hypothetical protein VKT23_000556 [Stygiomarasmius scandens]|uniref:F-box domain-containing protein n=1 Tax=Marasmiellus scandens TaxID=2682957 RepID=A0ABR1KAD4_9AGAR